MEHVLDLRRGTFGETVAQVAISTIGVGAFGVLDVDWVNVLSVSALAGIMSLLTSVLVYDKQL